MTRPAPSADLLARLARRFGPSPGHAAWRAHVTGDSIGHRGRRGDEGTPLVVGLDEPGRPASGLGHPLQDAGVGGVVGVVLRHAPETRAVPPGRQALPRGGHTELSLARFVHEDARIRGGGELPAVWSAYS